MAVQFKRFCETKIGVVSQCMIKPRQLNPQYLGNLALKINLKVRCSLSLQPHYESLKTVDSSILLQYEALQDAIS